MMSVRGNLCVRFLEIEMYFEHELNSTSSAILQQPEYSIRLFFKQFGRRLLKPCDIFSVLVAGQKRSKAAKEK